MNGVTPVTFSNDDGQTLFGFVHEPDKEKQKDSAIVLLSPGVKTRVGPHRLYLTMAQHFVEMGFTVFRFDFNGLGDAEGDVGEYLLADFYNTVALGRYINDTVSALDWMQNQYGFSKFILGGLCGGALTGLLAGQDDDRVKGLLALGIPCVLEQSKTDPANNISKGQLRQLRTGYFKKLLSVKSWLRLLTLKSDLRVMLRSIAHPIITRRKKAQKKQNPNTAKASEPENSNINPLFSSAFFEMAKRSKHMILIFSGADRLGWEFEEKFLEFYEYKLKKYSSMYEVYTVKDANHVFSNKSWQREMLTRASNWLASYYV